MTLLDLQALEATDSADGRAENPVGSTLSLIVDCQSAVRVTLNG